MHSYDPTTRKLYIKTDDGSYESRERHLHHCPIFKERSKPEALPPSALPAEVWDHGLPELMTEPRLLEVNAEPEPTLFVQYLSQLPYHEQQLMGKISLFMDKGELLAEAL